MNPLAEGKIPESILIRPLPHSGPVTVSPQLPPSKSCAARALVIAALSGKSIRPEPLPDCDDTVAIAAGLEAVDSGKALADIGAAGTAMRFLTAYAALRTHSSITLTGSQRMLRRPIGPLVDALRKLGAYIIYEGREGYPPINIHLARMHGGEITADASVSSQFISAVMMIAPMLSEPVVIRLSGRPASYPYIEMTARVMREFGASVDISPRRITVMPGTYSPPAVCHVESDWSAASYFYEACLVDPRIELLMPGLTDPSLSVQGDSRCRSLFEEAAGRPTLMRADMTDVPDLVPALAVGLALAGIPYRLSGIGSLRLKECDRVEVLRAGLARIGYSLLCSRDVMACASVRAQIPYGYRSRSPVPVIDTADDHRMAMAFACAGLLFPVRILKPEVVTKSFPAFWEQFGRLCIIDY